MSLTDGALYLETVRDITSLFTDRETHYRYYRYLLLAVVAVSGLVLYLLSTWLTRPIRSLRKTAAALAAGDYSARARWGAGMRSMSWRTASTAWPTPSAGPWRSWRTPSTGRREFTASFVHELKTPLTSIIGYADMLRSRELSQDMRFKAASYFLRGKRLEKLSCPS